MSEAKTSLSFVACLFACIGAALVASACTHREEPADAEGAGGTTSDSGAVGTGGSHQGTDAGTGGTSETDAGTVVPKTSCGDKTYADKYTPGYAQNAAITAEVNALVASMSLTQKATQMRGTATGGGQNYSDIFRTPNDTQSGIRGFLFRDGPRGVNLAAELPTGKSGYSTSFPAPMARGAAFDLDLEYRIGRAIGDETLAGGYTMMLAPTINILRHPAWGRAQETYGEDPYLLGRLGSAFTVGVQEYVPACAKHYAANNIENGRASINAQMDEQTLREIYARHYEMVIRDGGVACVMAAYNPLNGKHCTQNRHALTDILRDDFGFKGFVLSDWWAMPPGSNTSVTTDTLKANASEAVQAGLDMELPWSFNYSQLESITGEGLPVPSSVVNTAVSRILEQKLRFKVGRLSEPIGLKAPTTTFSSQNSIENNQAHVDIAYEAALKSMTLLKNEGNVLPIQRANVQRVAVLGARVSYNLQIGDSGTINFATDVRTGDLGSSRVKHDPAKSMGPFDGIRAAAGAGITVVSGSDVSVAQDADFIVVVAGLTPEDEGEEYTGAGDRRNFLLDGKKATNQRVQNTLITQAAALGKPMVVVLEGGSVIEMPWLAEVPAVVMAWYPGMVGGKALGALLFGDENFSGKLPISWPKRWEDLPTFSSPGTTVMDYYLGYRRFDHEAIEPLYPFGHGLSYTAFEYSNLQLPCTDVTKQGVVDVRVDVKNTGAVAGDEVVLLFVSYPESKARRPQKELKGFYRVSLSPGQTKQVTIPLRVSDLKYWDMTASKWVVESGTLKVHVGPSAASLPLSETVPVL
jgi:beta-glucosidase